MQQTQQKTTCKICGRQVAVVNGKLITHGPDRDGNDPCPGSRYQIVKKWD